ncbi:hypothetical protein [Cellulomonas fimi]|uniref:Uncharacterized protein n=1 Tax=Cellulomonas fimi (strain ATCC 484 / DSM 20113 / JCM 1341 / CCUG 24087 / LMG 16345 / NBRC 15513 / NCIMB 8980 / NCTC 7547 / NRS-133) TaxID=590998 RepID=F4GYL5_CELFA|nr:hypothetical protein [Cellulomonas fimi]AEE47132.1 hypothetical protein Celf_3015 [Cellulomonas fimi ATCC 484]NNH05626.1 hypothetical protein [Cellulomonas fimi]VEH35356.1 Uncharacterised protein [Cellulomonas fimi]
MPDTTIAVIDDASPFLFDVDAMRTGIERRWPRAVFEAPSGRLAGRLLATFIIPGEDTRGLSVDVPVSRSFLSVDYADSDMVGEFVEWLVTLDGFPGDGSVAMFDWADDVLPLRPGLTADEVSRELV